MKPIVIILMGSKSDLAHGQIIADNLTKLGVESVIRIGSAHKVPLHVLSIVNEYEADPRPKVYITIAGRSNALSGFTDPQVVAPVIACPPPSSSFSGADIYSSLRMPSGVAPAVVLEPVNAALLATKILALSNPELQQNIKAYQKAKRDILLADDAELQQD